MGTLGKIFLRTSSTEITLTTSNSFLEESALNVTAIDGRSPGYPVEPYNEQTKTQDACT